MDLPNPTAPPISWEEPDLFPPSHVTITLVIDLDGPTDSAAWSVTTCHGEGGPVFSMICKPMTAFGVVLTEAVSALADTTALEMSQLSPF